MDAVEFEADVEAAYRATIEELFAIEARRGWDLKLDAVRAALAELGSPERRVPAIHVAGTNGKGSTAAFAHAVLQAAGRRVGLFTSPHLVDFRERIRIGDEQIPKLEVVALTERIRAAASAAGVALTFFEHATVMAFEHFAAREVEMAVIEVGLGGRLDATNVVRSVVSVVTTIALDHEHFLGDTTAKIAAEKAGIVKAGVPVVTGRLPEEAADTVAAVAGALGAPLRRLGQEFELERRDGSLVYTGERRVTDLVLGLAGRVQWENAAVALAALEACGALEGVDDATIRDGLLAARWPGRLQRIAGTPPMLLDGAHNPDAMRALADELEGTGSPASRVAIFGVLADRRIEPIAETLARVVGEVIVVPVRSERAADPEAVARVFSGRLVVGTAPSFEAALTELRCRQPLPEEILVTGSLYLIGEALELLGG